MRDHSELIWPSIAVPVSCVGGTADIFCRWNADVDHFCPPATLPALNALAKSDLLDAQFARLKELRAESAQPASLAKLQ